MNSAEAIEFIHSFEKFGSKLGLETTAELLRRLDNPDKNLKFIHIAGTNGKGSTSSYIANSLAAAGYKTGIYISPYVNVFNERIQINGEYISDDELAQYADAIKAVIDDSCMPTEFEVVTAIGMLHFAKNKCDYVVLEVGLGGRFDATNVISVPEVSVITSISIDHTDILGDTEEKIAYEKCGIIKHGGKVVAYCDNSKEANKVICRYAKDNECMLTICDKSEIIPQEFNKGKTSFCYKGEEYAISMLGQHQIYNAVTAIEVLKQLNVPLHAIKQGLLKTRFGGRLEIISDNPTVLIDGAHNYSGVCALKAALLKYYPDKKITFIMGILKDKEYKKCIAAIAEIATDFIAVEPDNPRKLPKEQLAKVAAQFNGNVITANSKEDAVKTALGFGNDVICICGSLYLIGNIDQIFNK